MGRRARMRKLREEDLEELAEQLEAEPEKAAPQATLIPAPPEANCACNECPYMRLNTLEKIHACLRDMAPALEMDETLRLAALKPLERMLAL